MEEYEYGYVSHKFSTHIPLSNASGAFNCKSRHRLTEAAIAVHDRDNARRRTVPVELSRNTLRVVCIMRMLRVPHEMDDDEQGYLSNINITPQNLRAKFRVRV